MSKFRFSGCSALAAFLTVLTGLAGEAVANPGMIPVVNLDPARATQRLDGAVELLRDPTGQLSFDEVAAPLHLPQFQPNPKSAVNHGFTPDVYWYRLTLHNAELSGPDSDWVLEIDYPPLDAVDVHLTQHGNTRVIKTGDQRPHATDQLSHHNYAIPLSIAPGGDVTLHLRVRTEGSHQVPLRVWPAKAFLAKTELENLGFGLFFGIMLVMVIYNFFILLFVGDRAYIYYIGTLLFFALLQLNLTGFMRQYGQDLLGTSLYLNNLAVPVLVTAALMWVLLFARSFLQTRIHTPRTNLAINLILFFLTGCLALAFATPYATSVPASAALGAVTSPMLIVAGVAAWRAGVRVARFFVLAWAIFILGTLVKISELFGALPTSFFTAYSWQIGILFTVTLLSLALADRINVQRQESLDARGEALAAREQAVASLKRYGRIVENVLEGIFETDYKGRVVSANAAVAAMFGYANPDEMMRTVSDLRRDHIAQGKDGDTMFVLLRDHGQFAGHELRLRRRDGSEFWASVSMRVIRGDDGKVSGFDGIIADISERHEKEKMSRERAVAQAATAAKSEFLAKMSHELRTPMNAIIGFTDLALRSDSDQRRLAHLRHIETASQTLLHIINDILDLSKIEAGKLTLEAREFELQPILDRVAELVSGPAAAKGVEIIVECSREAPAMLIGDALRLQQILMNLMSNAVKFTERGEIELRVVRLSSEGGRAQLRFEVQDSGIGLTEEQRARLFTPFTQADQSTTRKYGGTGLGLAICRQLVELMGGQIGVESESGKGSRFFFTVNLLQGEPLSTRPSARNLRGTRVLVVDDNAAARRMYGEIIQSLQMVPVVAESGASALAALQREPCDLLLVDWKMPEMDGLETIRRIRAQTQWQSLPVILMTAHGQAGLAETAAAAGANRCLEKPIKPSLLLETLMELRRPGRTADTTVREPIQNSAAAQHLRGAQVLLVEDNAMNRRLAGEILLEAGVTLDQAENGQLAVQAVQQKDYHAVLMDVQMPVMDGFEATRAIRKLNGYAGLPIVAMTANAMDQDRAECLAAGMNDFLSKPIDAGQLLAMLSKWIRPKGAAAMTSSETPKPSGLVPASLPGIELAAAIKRIGGKQALLLELLHEFVAEQQNSADKIRADWAQDKMVDAARGAHSLKGLAANFGCDTLAEAARALEDGLKGDASGIEQKLVALADAFRQVQASVAQLPNPAKPVAAAPSASAGHNNSFSLTPAAPANAGEPLMPALVAFAALLQARDFQAPARFAEIEPRLRGISPSGDVDALSQALHRYDFEAAADVLQRLQQGLPA